jgi:hypothetical protein
VANLREEGLEAYLRTFESTYRDTVEAHIEPGLRAGLERYGLLDRRLIGYVSTNFGVAFEYTEEPRGDKGIETVRGSQRIEHIVYRGIPARQRDVAMIRVAGRNTRIMGMTLEGAAPVLLGAREADVILSRVRAVVGPWRRSFHHLEMYGDRAADRWTDAVAVGKAKDEVLVAALDQQQLQRREVGLGEFLERFKERQVLVLGDFKAGRDRLEEIASALRELSYEPVLLDAIPDPFDYDLRQKFTAVAHVCRFLVFEDSTAAGQLWEMANAQGSGLVRIVLRQSGTHSSFMSVGQDITSNVVHELDYELGGLAPAVGEAAQWAEQRIEELRDERAALYPWRSNEGGA